MRRERRIFDGIDAVSAAAAAEVARVSAEACKERGRFTMVLSGGSTPKTLYMLLADDRAWRERVPWQQTHFFWGDERHVLPDHEDSNFHMANEAMLMKVSVAAGNVHRIAGEDPDADRAARQYEGALREFFHLSVGEIPRFDLVLLGLGSDGHTASLFPGTRALGETKRIVVSSWVDKLRTDRITLAAPVFNKAAHVLFLVCGEDKAAALKGVLEGPHDPDRLPAQLIQPEHGRLVWLLDKSAASLLA